jgi:EAL domain-containing protein (putative c-di-GMP-specific phosphodiesterase class I)
LGWAKTNHRGHWTDSDQDRYAYELHRQALAMAMPVALHRGEFTLAYQPLVRLADRSVVGVEALARWHHPTLGTIPAAEFIPLAESTGLLAPLGLHLLETACTRAASRHTQAHSPFLLSVNLSASQLRSSGFATAVTAVLQRTGLPADRLQLEITEKTITDTENTTLETLDILARNGVQLAIDGFGTGASCLAHLTALPIHAVKLAPGFLRDLGEPATAHSNSPILPVLIKLSHDLGITVTAQGVETAAQAQRLTTLNCDFGQGFHFGHPTKFSNITKLLTQAHTRSE